MINNDILPVNWNLQNNFDCVVSTIFILGILLSVVGCSDSGTRDHDQTHDSGEHFTLELPENDSFSPGDEIPFKLISSNTMSTNSLVDENEQRGFDIYSDSLSFSEAFDKFHEGSTTSSEVPNIDFTQYEVLGIFHGFTQEAADEFELSRITQRENDAIGVVRFSTLGVGCSVVQGDFSPYQFVLIPRMGQTLEIAAEVVRNEPCILDPNLSLNINVRFIDKKSVVLTWNTPNFSDPIVGYEVQGDPVPNSQLSEEFLEIDTLVPGLYQRIEITPFTAKNEGRQTSTLYLSTDMPLGITEAGPDDVEFESFVSSFAGNEAINCDVGTGSFVLTSPCLIDSFRNGTAATYSSVSIGTDSLSGVGAVVSIDREVFLFNLESGVADREFWGFQCLNPGIVESVLVCRDCQNSTDNRCRFFSGVNL